MNKVLFKNCRYLICKAAPEKGILEDGAVYVEGPVIKAVGPTAEIERLVTDENTEVLDCRNKIVMPGLIDSHNHVGEYHQFLILGMSFLEAGARHYRCPASLYMAGLDLADRRKHL